jgi:hypothetical protein
MKINQLIFPVIFLMITGTASAQAQKKDADVQQTKIERFTSRMGTFSKFVDSKLPNLKCDYISPETRVRKLIVGAESVYFYQIEKSGQDGGSTASIEYSDLLEVIKALKALQTDVDKDIAAVPDYLENKFTTVDGFQIGYYVNKGKAKWYIKLEKFGSESTLFVDDLGVLNSAFDEAKAKIEELKKI